MKYIKQLLFISICLALLVVPIFFASAVDPQDPPVSIYNPLEGRVSDIPGLITIIVNAVKNIGYFVIVLFIIYSGFLFVKARGNDTEITKAKGVFMWTVVGAAVLLGAQILSEVIKGTVDNLQSTNVPTIMHNDTV